MITAVYAMLMPASPPRFAAAMMPYALLMPLRRRRFIDAIAARCRAFLTPAYATPYRRRYFYAAITRRVMRLRYARRCCY